MRRDDPPLCYNFNEGDRLLPAQRIPYLHLLAAAAASCLICGCAVAPRTAATEDMKVYQPAELAQGQYELIRRLWVDSWRTAFWLPNHPSVADGIAALKVEAARLGANGLIGVDCLDQGHFTLSRSREPAILCYANAIRVR